MREHALSQNSVKTVLARVDVSAEVLVMQSQAIAGAGLEGMAAGAINPSGSTGVNTTIAVSTATQNVTCKTASSGDQHKPLTSVLQHTSPICVRADQEKTGTYRIKDRVANVQIVFLTTRDSGGNGAIRS